MSDTRALFSTEQRERLLQLRRDLHRHPELAFQEERTAARLQEELARLVPAELARVAGTGVIARLSAREPGGPTVVIRGDIDALPIQEATGLEYSSERPGAMHACGHDVHATWAVGAAVLLSETPALGDVLVLLQPGEETGRGASRILESGALNDVDAIFGAHVDRRFAVGQVVAQPGPLAAAADTFSIELLGSGGHGARPHETRDPIAGLGTLIGALQTIVSRQLEPGRPGVVSIGTVQAGTAPNVIPDVVTVTGTLRAFDPATRDLLHGEVRRRAEGVATAHGLQARAEIEMGPPPIVNPPQPVEWARTAVRGLLGEAALVPMESPNMGGEDFAHYLERFTGAFLRIGAREPGGDVIPAHTPRFYAADGSIFVGAAVLAETARVAARALNLERRDR